MKRKQFTFYDSFYESICELKSARAREQCYDSICRYALRGEKLDMEALLPEARPVLRLVRPILDTASKRAAAGMAKKQTKNKCETKSKQKQNKIEIKTKTENELKIELKRDSVNAGARERFDIFWDMYPKKVDKEGAWVEFQRTEESLQVLLDALREHKLSAQWLEDGGRFIPKAAQWLKQQRWMELLPRKKDNVPVGATGELGSAELAAIQRMLAEG